MAIDIDKLTEPELIDLNNRIVARLRFLQQIRAHAAMLEFSLGEHVTFQPEGHPVLSCSASSQSTTGSQSRSSRKPGSAEQREAESGDAKVISLPMK